MSNFKQYTRTNIAEMRPYIPGEDLSNISVNDMDNPEITGIGMIARNPANHKDMWYVSHDYFKSNFKLKDIEDATTKSEPELPDDVA